MVYRVVTGAGWTMDIQQSAGVSPVRATVCAFRTGGTHFCAETISVRGANENTMFSRNGNFIGDFMLGTSQTLFGAGTGRIRIHAGRYKSTGICDGELLQLLQKRKSVAKGVTLEQAANQVMAGNWSHQ
jgi:hypothetical protein